MRQATLRDLDVLVLHRHRMFEDMGGYTREELDASDPVFRRWVRPKLKSGEFVAWIAEARGEVAASGGVWLQRVQPRPTLHASEMGRPVYESLGWVRTWEMAWKPVKPGRRAPARARREAPRR